MPGSPVVLNRVSLVVDVMGFESILFNEENEAADLVRADAPEFFHDLNLDQLVEQVTAEFKEYDLAPLYYTHLTSLDTILYRQDIMADLGNPALREVISSFSSQMRGMRGFLERSRKAFQEYARQRSFLTAADIYCATLKRLRSHLLNLPIESHGFLSFREYLIRYLKAAEFCSFAAKVDDLKTALASVRYCLLLQGDSVTVQKVEAESDYSESVEAIFEKFRCDASERFSLSLKEVEPDNHIQAQVMAGVAELYPEVFQRLVEFRADHEEFVDRTIARFEREVQFYLAFLAFIDRLQRVGLSFCRPTVSAASKHVTAHDAFDLVLAGKLSQTKARVVCNDFSLRAPERILVVSGPNHGGKSTFARMFGQMHYLGSLGLPVPGIEARLFLFDQLFTHFEREENIASLRGKLQDDLVRMHDVLSHATPASILVMNEVFSSTTLRDAVFLSRQMLARVSNLDLLCVCVTFLDELASFDEKTVSVVGVVDSANPAMRTFRLVRKPADGLAYAYAIAEKHGVTYAQLMARVGNGKGERAKG